MRTVLGIDLGTQSLCFERGDESAFGPFTTEFEALGECGGDFRSVEAAAASTSCEVFHIESEFGIRRQSGLHDFGLQCAEFGSMGLQGRTVVQGMADCLLAGD